MISIISLIEYRLAPYDYISSFSFSFFLFLMTHVANEIHMQFGEMYLFQEFNETPMSIFVPKTMIYEKNHVWQPKFTSNLVKCAYFKSLMKYPCLF